MVSEVGSGHRAGGADPAGWVGTAGTVAMIDLRLPHHPRLGSPLLRYVLYNRSQARARPAVALAFRSFTRSIHTVPASPPPSAVFAPAANSARRERTRALQWAACLGTRAARRRGASATTWSPARVLAGDPRNVRPFLPCPCLVSAAAFSRNVVPMHRHLHTSRQSSRRCAVRGRGSAEALCTLLPRATSQHSPHSTSCCASQPW